MGTSQSKFDDNFNLEGGDREEREEKRKEKKEERKKKKKEKKKKRESKGGSYDLNYQKQLDKKIIKKLKNKYARRDYLNFKNQYGGMDLNWSNDTSREKCEDLMKYLGNPNYISTKYDTNDVEYVKWQLPLDQVKVKLGKFNGVDLLRINDYNAKKRHPYEASVFVIVGKYLHVPDHLLGALKYASETINIEQLFVPKRENEEFIQTGKKKIVLLTGSCASVTVSCITIKFAEDMIKMHKDNKNISVKLLKSFKKEYDNRIKVYIDRQKIEPSIPWFNPQDFGEHMSKKKSPIDLVSKM